MNLLLWEDTIVSPLLAKVQSAVTPEIKILLNQDIREVFTLFLYYDIILESSYQVPSVI